MLIPKCSLSELLLESDRIYFEAAAKVYQFNGYTITVMPGIKQIAASCVIQRLNYETITQSWQQWLREVEKKIHNLGVPFVRIYLTKAQVGLEQELYQQGYRQKVEVGLVTEDLSLDSKELELMTAIKPNIRLYPITSQFDWQKKLQLHLNCSQSPDGHVNTNNWRDWVEMERQKCDSGVMKSYLVEYKDQICGTVASMDMGDLLRLKNLVINPEWRRLGLAVATTQALKNIAHATNKQRMGCFAVSGDLGEKVYRKAKMQKITQ